jgi:RNA polymerase primary sigma factor
MRELPGTTPLDAAAEAAMARRIAGLRGAVWRALLAHAALVPAIAGFLARELDDPPLPLLSDLRAAAQSARGGSGRAGLARAVAAVAEALTWNEPELRTAAFVHREVERVAAGGIPSPRLPLRVPRRPGRAFADYRAGIDAACREYDAARREFAERNLRLVIAVARHYDYGLLSATDLVQEGNLGLMKAVDRFDPRRGTRFSTFAVWWIRHKITRALANHGRTIRLPVHVAVDHLNLRKAERKLQRELGRAPSDDELGRLIQRSPERVALTRRAVATRPISANAPVRGDGIGCVQDTLRAEEDGFARLEVDWDLPRLREAMWSLPRIERDILRRRFGFPDGEERTLAEIGQVYRLSRERIRQLQNRALERLRARLEVGPNAA